MRRSISKVAMLTCLAATLAAQEPTPVLDPTSIRQAIATEKDKTAPVEAAPKADDAAIMEKKLEQRMSDAEPTAQGAEASRRRREAQLRALKEKDADLPRFAQDLFNIREEMPGITEGGIADDYVLGVGDQILVAGFGSAAFEVPSRVDGKGEVLIPKLGSFRVSGMTVGKAKAFLQQKVSRDLAGTRIELSVTKLREVRVYVLGEVYLPGSYLVPSLSSLVNVLSLSGGPTSKGSYREIRVMRGGSVVHTIDLYPLRAEGKGNMNFSLQNGDTIFVPLAHNKVLLQGAFTRLAVGQATEKQARPANGRRTQDHEPYRSSVQGRDAQGSMEAREADHPQEDSTPRRTMPLEGYLPSNPDEVCFQVMSFEMLPTETAQEAFNLAGGLLPGASLASLTLRRTDANGLTDIREIPLDRLAAARLAKGDVLSALSSRERNEQLVELKGWVRVPGVFARTEGLRVGDLLKAHDQIMPDTYLKRGEIIRTLPDGSTRFLAFDVDQAIKGLPAENPVLENRDKVTLYRMDRLRLPRKVSLLGPFTHAGSFDFHEGMRVSDLLFMAGIPLKGTNHLTAELARSVDGKPSQVRRLDLKALLSDEHRSPVDLKDEAINPLLVEDDQISVYALPDYRTHRVVEIRGQVANPGIYVLDEERMPLSHLIKRAGGLTQDAMPSAGIFFRGFQNATRESGLLFTEHASGVNEILDRLNETKIYDSKILSQTLVSAQSGTSNLGGGAIGLFKLPVLHGLNSEKLNRVVVDFRAALGGKAEADIELADGDTIVIPRKTDTAMVLGEAATPFAFYKVVPGMSVSQLMDLAGGTTRNADTGNLRLLKADGRIIDRWVKRQTVEPGDSLLIPQVVRRDTNWQENLAALTPLAIMINALKK